MATYNNDMVAHVWAQQSEDSGKNGGDSFYFTGATIYSYGSHFPIAKFVKSNVVLFTIDTYGNTTSRHISYVSRAIPSYCKVFNVPNMDIRICKNSEADYIKKQNHALHVENLEYLKESALESLAKSHRARSNKPWLVEQAERLTTEYNEYKAEFGIKRKNFALPDMEQHRAAVEKQRIKDQAREAKHKREIIKINQEKIQCWKDGTENRLPWGVGSQISVMLRIKPTDSDTVQTSQNAEFPVEHAVKAYRLIKIVKESGQSWCKNGHSIKLGHFEIDTINIHGDIKAGCHVVGWSEIERMGELLLSRETIKDD